jgi:predicted 3-demethylubiquinone-9 3-methyltransferase (glyoxalase superfamily)
MSTVQKITPNLWFNGNAEEAAEHYVSIFPNSRICRKLHITEDVAKAMGVPEGSLLLIEFELDGQIFQGLNGGPQFTFNEAISLVVNCKDQQEVDRYWEKLGAGGDKEAQQCGWLKDKFGVSWQVVPTAFIDMITDKDPVKVNRAMAAMMRMKKLNLAEMTKAFNGK